MNDMSNNWDNLAEEAVEALLNGPGYYLAESVFTADEVAAANRIINAHSDVAQAATHFHGEHADKIHLQRRVWNLLNKGQVFVDMVQHPLVMKVFGKILGRQFILGSFAANRLLPGAPGQEPHIDYPYWDLHDPDEFPAGINGEAPSGYVLLRAGFRQSGFHHRHDRQAPTGSAGNQYRTPPCGHAHGPVSSRQSWLPPPGQC